MTQVKKVKVSHSLIVVGVLGLESHRVSWAHLMRGGAHPSPFAAFSFSYSKRYPITAELTEGVFQWAQFEI